MTALVIDTNVLVSGMINAFGMPGRIVDLLREGLVEAVVDDRILAEYADVLLVTGNVGDFPVGCRRQARILTPARFLGVFAG